MQFIGKLYRLKSNEQFIIQIVECNGIPSMVKLKIILQ
jgi:hypothetical protein